MRAVRAADSNAMSNGRCGSARARPTASSSCARPARSAAARRSAATTRARRGRKVGFTVTAIPAEGARRLKVPATADEPTLPTAHAVPALVRVSAQPFAGTG
jgi:hypothetical protein